MKIHYPIEWNELVGYEIKCKGWLAEVKVSLDDGSNHVLNFYDPERLAQDLQEEIKLGKSGIIEKGLLVIPEVTEKNIEKAIIQAVESDFFD